MISINHLERGWFRMDKIKRVVSEISGRRNKECYYILCQAVAVAREFAPVELQMKVLLPEVRKRTKKKQDKTVSKALSRAVEDIWLYGDRKKLEEVFKRPLYECPTPKALINQLVQYLDSRLSYQLWQDPLSGDYGILVQSDGQQWASAIPIDKDRQELDAMVASFNRTQLPIDQFLEMFLSW